MGIEERIEHLENLCIELAEKLEQSEAKQHDRFVTSKELAEIMGCSVNNVYIKIRKGEIFATDKLGAIPRIPLSQFYSNYKPRDNKPTKRKKLINNIENDMDEIRSEIFG